MAIYGTAMGAGPLVQGYRIWRRRASSDVSLFSLSLIGLGCAFWMAWGIVSYNPPLIIANVVACFAYTFAIAMAIYFRGARR